MQTVSKGAAGEVLAARFLREKGYTILSTNYRIRQGEIDIIAAAEPYIAFVEVKTRRQSALYTPREAVHPAKQRRIVQTAAIFLRTHPTPLQPRFDVVEIITADDNPMQVLEWTHILNAFDVEGLGAAF